MKRSEIVSRVAKVYPPLFRSIFTHSVRGTLLPIHKHWLMRSIAADLFEDQGFPMRGTPYRLYIPKELQTVYLGYFDFLDHEPLTSRVFERLLRPGDVVIDVGANIGHYSLLAASVVGPLGRVHAFECSPETLALLSNNVAKNKLQNIAVHPFAASDERGALSLNVTAIGLSWFTPHSNWPVVSGSGTSVEVQTVPVDDIVSAPVNLVKIDAEGVDLNVLKGMKRILSESPGVSIIVEWAPPLLVEAGKDPMEIIQWLQNAGFSKISVIDEKNQKQISLEDAVALVHGGKLPRDWVGDLLAQK
jgi:FkbM family methyltransferase